MKAALMASVLPVTVTMRSGHEPSEMLIRAELCVSQKSTEECATVLVRAHYYVYNTHYYV